MNTVHDAIPTRQSLLSRLKDSNDEEGWKTFFDTYWRLIYNAARKAGLTDAEAQDVVQETVLSVLKSIPGFEYDPKKGSFKSWLLRLTSWRISDQFRKRQRGIEDRKRRPREANRTATVERVIDPASLELETTWDREWEQNLMDAAIERVKKKVDPKHYQIYHFYVTKEWPVSKVAQTFKINTGKVYLIKHRVGQLIKKEVAHLRSKPM